MENEKNTNKNSSSIMVWIIIGILVVAAIVVVIVTTNQTSRPSVTEPIVADEPIEDYIEQEEGEIDKLDEFITQEELEDIYKDMEKDCIESGGVFLDDRGCQMAGSIYYNYDWQIVDEMILNCQENNGRWIEESIACLINGTEYINFQWDNIERLQNLTRQCNQAGGNWVDGYWECENVSDDWCEEINGWNFDECASSCRHIDDPEIICTTECVSVCYF